MTTLTDGSPQSVIDHLIKLLRGACITICETAPQGEKAMGPELRKWWSDQPEYNDEQARRVLLSLPERDIDVLRTYIKRHGELPDWD